MKTRNQKKMNGKVALDREWTIFFKKKMRKKNNPEEKIQDNSYTTQKHISYFKKKIQNQSSF